MAFVAVALLVLAGAASGYIHQYRGYELETVQLSTPYFGVSERGSMFLAACNDFVLVSVPGLETDDLTSQGFGQVYIVRRADLVDLSWEDTRSIPIASPFGNSRYFGAHVACSGSVFVVSDVEPSTGLPTYHNGVYDAQENVWWWEGLNMLHDYDARLRGTMDTMQLFVNPVDFPNSEYSRIWIMVNNATAGEASITWSADVTTQFSIGGSGNVTLVHGCTDGGISASFGGKFNVFTTHGTDCGDLYVLRNVAGTDDYVWQTSLQRSLADGYGVAVQADYVLVPETLGVLMYTCVVYVSSLSFTPTLRVYSAALDTDLSNSDPNTGLVWATENEAYQPYGFGNGQGSGVGFGRFALAKPADLSYSLLIGSAAPGSLPGAQWLRVLSPKSNEAGGEQVNELHPVLALDGMSVDCSLYATPNNPLVPRVGDQVSVSENGLIIAFRLCEPVGVPGVRTSVIGLLTFRL